MKRNTSPNPPRHGGSRLAHAIRLWERYLHQERLPPLDRWLASELKLNKQFGKRDRYWYSEMLFTAVRFGVLASLVDFLDQSGDPAPAPAALQAGLEAFCAEHADPRQLPQAWRKLPSERLFHVVGRRYLRLNRDAPWPLVGLEAGEAARLDRLIDAVEGLQSSDLRARLIWDGVPPAFAAPLRQRAELSGWSESDLTRFLEQQAIRPPLWLRLNHPERKAEALDEFERNGLEAVEEAGALRLRGDKGVMELECYKKGTVEIQDWASQQIGVAVDARPGELIWDACAGGGGKTVQLAAGMGNRGAVYASDIREYKLKEVRRRSSRAGFDNVRLLPWAGEALPAFAREVNLRGGFNAVLVDAPCSSSGTWRRNPDARLRVAPDDLGEMSALQRRLLINAAAAVRPGGRLIYSTCSWLALENEQAVAALLGARPEFRLRSQMLHGSPHHDSDTLFCAVFERSGDSA